MSANLRPVANSTPFTTRHPLSATTRKAVAALLNQSLADLSDLYSQVKQAHWNAKGSNFIALHKLFDALAATIEPHVDTVAERAVTLGAVAKGTLIEAVSRSQLPELSREFDSTEVLVELADRFAKASGSAYAAIEASAKAGDPVSADLQTAIAATLDKGLYFLEAHLQDRTSG